MAHPKPDFTVKWATNNLPLTPISDPNQNDGWSYLGATPPTADEFDYWFNLTENKAKWLEEEVTRTPSETATAMIEVATQAETDSGTDDARAVTPKKLRAGVSLSLTSNGYIALPSWLGGIIFQWGRVNTTSGEGSVIFPISYTSSVYTVVATDITSGSYLTVDGCGVSTPTLTGFNASSRIITSGGAATTAVYWISIGK